MQYHFVDEKRLSELQDAGKVIELRAYQVVGGVWKYFTVDDEQTDLDTKDYLAIGTLVSYENCGIIMGQNELCRFMSRLRTGCVWQGPWIGNAVR